jgi:serine/threonine protein phosphatase PrpC
LAAWRAIGQTVRGAAHRRTGQVNQDALGWYPTSGTGPPLVLAVADGHGSAKYFRSEDGARFAVSTAHQVARQFLLEAPPAELAGASVEQLIREHLPGEVLRSWANRVRVHRQDHPFSPQELAALEKKEGPAARRLVESNPLLAYGTTLMTVIVTDTFIAYLQLGDGDVVAMSATRAIGRPLANDPRLFANETTSLSSDEKEGQFRVGLHVHNGEPPALILACTDGYANSYPHVADPVMDFTRDLFDLTRDHGPDRVQANLESWLLETTEKGSGDDITVGILCHLDAFAPRPAGDGQSRKAPLSEPSAATPPGPP